MNKLPDDVFSIIIPFIEKKYNFSISCNRFNNLFKILVTPSDKQIVTTFKKPLSDKTLTSIIRYEKANLAVDYNLPIIFAAKYGRYEIVKMLLCDKRVDSSDLINAVSIACKYGHYKIVQLLLSDQRFDYTKYIIDFVILAQKRGNFDIVKLLLNYKIL